MLFARSVRHGNFGRVVDPRKTTLGPSVLLNLQFTLQSVMLRQSSLAI